MYGLDLFSGIGGITKALEGYVTPVAYCERDRYAQGVLLSRMFDGSLPVAPIWDDVTTLRGDMLPPIDIIYGGFPCQDISVAGRGIGLEGKRSGLFFEIARLVGELRPKFIFLENVSAIRIRGGDVVAGTLAGLGYDCRWSPLSAADVGANHERERWWLLAHSRRELFQRAIEQRTDVMETRKQYADKPQRSSEMAYSRLFGSSECEIKTAGIIEHGQEVSNSQGTGFKSGTPRQREIESWRSDSRRSTSNHWLFEPNVGRVAHGVPFRVDRLKGLGNSVVPAQAREAFERLMGVK